MKPKTFTVMEASTICRVLCAIEYQCMVASREGRDQDAKGLYRILGKLQAANFPLGEPRGCGYYDSPLADPKHHAGYQEVA